MDGRTLTVPGSAASPSTSGSAASPWAAPRDIRDSLPPAVFIVLWSTGYIAGKIAVAHGAPFTVLTLRFLGAALIFAALAAFGSARWPDLRGIVHSAVVGLLSLALQFGGVYAGLGLGATAGFAALIIGAMPLATSIGAAALGERLSAQRWLGLALGFTGVLLVLQDRLSGLGSAAAGLALLVGLAGISAGTLYQKRYAVNVDLRVGLLIQHAAATAVLAPIAIFAEGLRFDDSLAFRTSMLWLILVNSVGGFALMFLLLRHGAATRVATLFFLIPPVTALMGSALMHESLSTLKLAGLALAALGVYLGARR